MIKTEKKKKPFVLNREQHRHLKSLSKDALTEWLRRFYCEVYNEAISETYLAVMRHLHDDNDKYEIYEKLTGRKWEEKDG